MNKLLKVMLLCLCTVCTQAQPVERELSWEELQSQHEFPEWYLRVRFGIWATIGPQSVPRLGGGWYARHMFMQDVGSQQFGRNAYAYHQKTYGPSLFVFVLNPQPGNILLPSLGTGVGKIRSIRLLGGSKNVRFRQGESGLDLEVPSELPTPYTAVFEVKGIL